MGKFYSTKTYGTDRGLSCCFRQWRATHSHCSMLHGYSIGIRLVFECDNLDEKNWVMDFGALDAFKSWAEYMFDHTLVIAEDDPNLADFQELAAKGVADIRIVPAVGCERFSELAYNKMSELISNQQLSYPVNATVRVKSVEVFEHGANSAVYEG